MEDLDDIATQNDWHGNSRIKDGRGSKRGLRAPKQYGGAVPGRKQTVREKLRRMLSRDYHERHK